MTPRVSVITPVYNAEKTLLRCVNSVLAQTMPDFELLLIDNNSSDDSGAIIRRLAQGDGRIRPLHEGKQGVSAARNLGIENARGDYLFFLDSDDALAPNALEMLLEEAVSSESDIVFPAIDRGGDDHAPEKARACHRGTEAIARAFAGSLGRYGFFNIFALYRLAMLNASPPLRFKEDCSLGEDLLFNLAALRRAASVSSLPDKLYRYAYHFSGDGLSAKFRPDMADTKGMLADEIRAYLEENHVWDGAAERAYAAMLCQDAFACAGNCLRGAPGDRRRAFDDLCAQPWVVYLKENRDKWPTAPARRLFLAALAAKNWPMLRAMIAFYRRINR
ncbi:MAG: glycosyltransferase family 2 protein [Oscillospiraceae bacterium]|jgi:glycosyltransferase involved in cell wall biosynthesis|nr:glycosyltransferase family 2 protein [Oscillospiraceae bacterium]